jgi:hypothetical protein
MTQKWMVTPIRQPPPPPFTCDGIDLSPSDRYVDFGNDAGFANLALGDFTIEGWFWMQSYHPSTPPMYYDYDMTYPLFVKAKTISGGHSVGWSVGVQKRAHDAGVPWSPYYPCIMFNMTYRNIDYPAGMQKAQLHYSWNGMTCYGDWVHIAVTNHTYEGEDPPGTPNTNNEAHAFLNGTEATVFSATADWPIDWTPDNDDTTASLILGGNGSYSSTRTVLMQWCRLSNSVRYPAGVPFTPNARCDPPILDYNTLAQWPATEVYPVYRIDNIQGITGRDGIVINPT